MPKPPGLYPGGLLFGLNCCRQSVPIMFVVVAAARGPDHGAGRLIEDQFARLILVVIAGFTDTSKG